MVPLALLSCAVILFPPSAAAEPSSIVIALNPRNIDLLKSELDEVSDPASPRYRRFYDRDAAHEITAPPRADVDAALAWAVSCASHQAVVGNCTVLEGPYPKHFFP